MLLGAAANLQVWFRKVLKMKSIYQALSMFKDRVTGEAGASKSCLIGACWVPVVHLCQIQLALRRGTVSDTLTHSLAYLACLTTLMICFHGFRSTVSNST